MKVLFLVVYFSAADALRIASNVYELEGTAEITPFNNLLHSQKIIQNSIQAWRTGWEQIWRATFMHDEKTANRRRKSNTQKITTTTATTTPMVPGPMQMGRALFTNVSIIGEVTHGGSYTGGYAESEQAIAMTTQIEFRKPSKNARVGLLPKVSDIDLPTKAYKMDLYLYWFVFTPGFWAVQDKTAGVQWGSQFPTENTPIVDLNTTFGFNINSDHKVEFLMNDLILSTSDTRVEDELYLGVTFEDLGPDQPDSVSGISVRNPGISLQYHDDVCVCADCLCS